MKKILAFLLFTVIFTACRYEDGPYISFYSPEHRLISSWSLQKLYKNGVQVSTSEWQANQIGNLYTFYTYGPMMVTTYVNGALRESYTGSWQFQNGERELKISFFLIDKSYDYTAKIYKLSRRELTYGYTDDNGDTWKLYFYAQTY